MKPVQQSSRRSNLSLGNAVTGMLVAVVTVALVVALTIMVQAVHPSSATAQNRNNVTSPVAPSDEADATFCTVEASESIAAESC